MLHFWIAWTLIMVVITACSFVNNSLQKLTEQTIDLIKDKLRSKLLLAGFAEQVRVINRDRLPELEDWHTGAVWYGLLTLGLMGLMALTTLFATVFHNLPYILLIVTIMLLSSMVVFFPRTVTRRAKTIAALANYEQSLQGLQSLDEENTANGNIDG